MSNVSAVNNTPLVEQTSLNLSSNSDLSPQTGLIEIIKYRVTSYTGIENISVSYVNNILNIEFLDLFESKVVCLLKAMVFNQYFKEIYGRFKDVGLNPYEVMYLKS